MYYDGSKLLSLKDVDGETPTFYLAVSNKTAGKTTYFERLLLNRFFKKGKLFALLYRFKYQLSGAADQIERDLNYFFPGHELTSKQKVKGCYYELYIDKMLSGYAIAINSADFIKNYSHVFNDVESIFFDEFQSETSHYCEDEIKKFRMILTAISRGQGKQYRYVPVYMASNPITLLNPYFVAFGIADKIKDDTKFLRGKRVVVEHNFNESANSALTESGLIQAFPDREGYGAESTYIKDYVSIIGSVQGKNKYLCTFKYDGKLYSIREYKDFVYCSDNVDTSYPVKFSVLATDVQSSLALISSNSPLLLYLKECFRIGLFRFKNAQCKKAIFKLVSASV